ncbi:hypothetical protein SAMN02745119_03067 [Trichlorobacter thiogenes]|uniref:Uncharacterized protein n=1 Tax=Trichlorobacter thiogenes TaxID=115783 RepID=A0A1T4RT92_9BACT|nr:hypothetical protein [Trichlorobacter thiogenes]SKA19173.1 hypothetical protein SAMN02745119_03067 [Trichlorobacter thiogenes]
MNTTDNQNLILGIIAGCVAAIVGAIAWALITVATGYQIGWMAVGVGFLVGYSMKYLGKGTTVVFGIIAAVIALVGCVAGNLLTTVILVAKQEHLTVMSVLQNLTPTIVMDLLKETSQPMDLLFYGLAVYEAYKFSFTSEEQEMVTAQPEEN